MNAFLEFLKHLASEAAAVYADRDTVSKWDATVVDGATQTNFTLTKVSIELDTLEFDFTYQNTTYQLVAIPGLNEYSVKVNGVADATARVVYRPVPSIANPFRFHLDFKGVTLGSRTVRVNFAYPR